jgi:hypothetical protein
LDCAIAAIRYSSHWPPAVVATYGTMQMTEEERTVMRELRQELMRLRNNALRDGAAESEATASRIPGEIEQSLSASPYRFPDGQTITIVCAQWPPHMLSEIPIPTWTIRTIPSFSPASRR